MICYVDRMPHDVWVGNGGFAGPVRIEDVQGGRASAKHESFRGFSGQAFARFSFQRLEFCHVIGGGTGSCGELPRVVKNLMKICPD